MRLSGKSLLCWLALFVSHNIFAAAPPVIVAPVEQTAISNPIEALGTLSARESIILTAKVTDTVRAIHFRDGQRVEAGQLLIEIDDAEEQAQLQEAKFTRDEAEQQLKRVRSLVAKGSASDAELDLRRREFQVAEARYRIIEAQISDRMIRAPFAGRIGLRQVSPGALVTPGETLTTLDDDSVMQLDFPIPSVFLGHVTPGDQVAAKVRAFPERTFSGEIVAIAGRVDPTTRAITARAMLDNSDFLLRPGLLVSITLQSREREALTIPEEAIIPEGANKYVLLIDQSDSHAVAIKKAVKIGIRTNGKVEILDGLTAGQRVIIHGVQHARPGQPVTVRELGKDETIADLLRANSKGVN